MRIAIDSFMMMHVLRLAQVFVFHNEICLFYFLVSFLLNFFSLFFGHNIIIKEDNKIPLIERCTFICSLYINLPSWHIMCGVWMSMKQKWKTTLVGGETCKMHLQTFRRLNIWFYFQFFPSFLLMLPCCGF